MTEEQKILQSFKSHLWENAWFTAGERVLLAVSGGLDSVVMVDLFHRAGFSFGIAHVNFQLRGAASDGDADFVRQLAAGLEVPYYETVFSTQKKAEERKLSIQVMARELRYEWLEEIRSAHGYAWIATAHHLNDSFETALYNWTKGTGIRGLLGIPRQNGLIIRPLLFTGRESLERYAQENALQYRTDASNLEDKYSRNKIRHHVWPVLKKINPGLEETFRGNLERLGEIHFLYEWALDRLQGEWTQQTDEEFRIAVSPLRTFPAARTLLYEWLKEFHFSNRQTDQVFDSMDHEPGAVFYSSTHRLLLDREWLLVRTLADREEADIFPVSRADQTVPLPEGVLEMLLEEGCPETFPTSAAEAFLDADRLTFPLRLRRWLPGDRFAPLGMHGKHQKLQDFFSNQKISLFEKERVWLLVSGDGEVAWIVGHRPAEPFKITAETTNYLHLHFRKV